MFSQTTNSLTMARRIGFVVLSVLFGVAAVIVIVGRGPWYDEFYSLYVVRAGVPVSALYPAWLRDNHPPLFYALAWVWSRLISGTGLAATVEGMRAINGVFLAVLVGAFVRMARTDAWFARIVWYDCLALAAMFPTLDTTPRLGEIKSPTLIVCGDQDTGTPLAMARILQQGIRGAELAAIANAGHLSNIEQPVTFISALERFYERIQV